MDSTQYNPHGIHSGLRFSEKLVPAFAPSRNVQYRILYFFHGQNVAILAHALIKEGSPVPTLDIERAIKRKEQFEKDPDKYTYSEETENG